MELKVLPSLAEKFIKKLEQEGKSQFTLIAYKKDIEQFLGFLTSKTITDIREVKKNTIEEFLKKLSQEEYIPKSISRKLNSIRTFFRFLKNEGIIDYNPALDVSHPKYTPSNPRILSKLEYMALRDYAKKDVRTYALIELLLQTGLRIGELANLRLSDIKEDKLLVRGYDEEPQREVPLNKSAKKAIDEYLKIRPETKYDHLFITRTGKPLLIRNIRQIITKYLKEVGIEDATVNDLRNTFIAHQLASGVSIEYVSKIVGHKRISSTERFLSALKSNVEKREKLVEL